MKRLYSTVFLVSFAVLIFEVSLTRLFSIHLSYHFAFLILSIAMFGTGAAGTILSLKKQPPIQNRSEGSSLEVHSGPAFSVYAFLASLSLIASLIVLKYITFDPVQLQWDKWQLLNLAFFCLTLSTPFFFAGLLFASAFLKHSNKSGTIYGFDLIGAGAGAGATFIILNFKAPEAAVMTAPFLCLLGAFISGKKRIRILTVIFSIILLTTFQYFPDSFSMNMSPFKQLPQYLKYPGAEHFKTYHSSQARIDTFQSPAVRFAPGLSLNYLEQLPDQVGLASDGNVITAITDTRKNAGLSFLQSLLSALPYETGMIKNVLTIDPLAGMPVIMARQYGAASIHKVESNAALIEVVKNEYGDYSGHLYDNDTWTGLSRNVLGTMPGGSVMKTDIHRYDLINISMTGVSVSGFFGIAEDYRYTVEAFTDYLDYLADEGYLSVTLYLMSPPRSELRILASVIEALEKKGIDNITDNITAVRSWDSIIILFKISPLSKQEILRIKTFCQNNRFDAVYYPGIDASDTNRFIKRPDNFLHESFLKLIDPGARSAFMSDYIFDISPVYDDSPFFNYHLRLKNAKAIYHAMGKNWLYFIDEGYLFLAILFIAFMFSTAIIIIPVALQYSGGRAVMKYNSLSSTVDHRIRLRVFGYFGALGMGFMFAEVAIIQKGILILENPSYTFAVVVASILLGSGAGSMMSDRFKMLRLPYELLFPAAFLALYSMSFHFITDLLTTCSMTARIIIFSLLTLPLGFFMGIPFPLGIKLLGKRCRLLIPWAWAVNACLSVLAPVLAIMLAIVTGFSYVLIIAALLYVLAFFPLRELIRC